MLGPNGYVIVAYRKGGFPSKLNIGELQDYLRNLP